MHIVEQQKLWDSFLQRWPLEKLQALTLEQYVSVNDKDTFTYWLETKTRDLGSIQGNTSAKFGIYKRNGEGTIQSGIGHGEIYSWRTKYGQDEQSSFVYVKASLLDIVEAVHDNNLEAINQIDFSNMVKWKIAFLYQHQNAPCLVNIFSKQMLEVLLDAKSTVDFPTLYQQLLTQKETQPLLEFGRSCWKKAAQKKEHIKQKQIFKKFEHVNAFSKNRDSWSDEIKTSFCRLIEVANINKLDIYTTNMTNGDMLRIGRKEIGADSAESVFATLKPMNGEINYQQRFNYPKGNGYFHENISSTLIDKIIKSKELAEFNKLYPITRKPYWPNAFNNELEDDYDLFDDQNNGKAMNNNAPLNQILYGPPGTGKTYHTIEAAVKAATPHFEWQTREQLKFEYDRLVDQKKICFVTFHQSYGYEEFVEGLKAKTTDDKTIEYIVENGVFKTIVEDAKSSSVRKSFEVNANARIWKVSIDGTGKSETSNYCLANGLAAIGWGESGDLLSEALEDNEYYQKLGPQVKSSLSEFSQRASVGDLILCIGSQRTVQAVGVISGDYHFELQGTSAYDDYCNQLPVNWLVTDIDVDFYDLNDGVNFTQKTFYELWRLSVADVFDLLKKQEVTISSLEKEQGEIENYVLVIDEINRGNISKIFGELITLIEPSKRAGQLEALELTLPSSGKPFSVPDNLYLIGTMNTADRSLAMMDTALRRRFDFIEMMPKPELFKDKTVKGIHLQNLLRTMNERIEVLYDREHTLGHAFLIPVLEALDGTEDNAGDEQQAFMELQNAFKNKIIPLLEEYFYDDWNKIRLVLGDSLKKSNELKFIEQTESTYNDLFGADHGLELYDDKQLSYKIKPFGKGTVWDKAQAYIEIYSLIKTLVSES